jgi:hypothetical protein
MAILDQFSQYGLNLNFGFGQAINKTANMVLIVILFGLFAFVLWKIADRKKYNIVIRGHDLRDEHDFEFDDMAREYIDVNKSYLKFLKRKKANVVIPDLRYYRSMVDGRRVIHAYKFGAVNDYVILDPKIVQEYETITVVDEKGTPVLDKEGKEITITRPKYILRTTNSLSKEHSVRDLRDALARFKKEDAVQKWTPIVIMVVIGLTILLSAWIMGHYQLKSANINLQATQLATDTLNKWLSFQQNLGIPK